MAATNNFLQVTVLDTGGLPSGAIISLYTGSIKRHAQVEKNQAISLPYASGSDPVRVDVMSELGSHTFDMVPGQDLYEVPITAREPGGRDVTLSLRVAAAAEPNPAATAGDPDGNGVALPSPSSKSPSRKLQTALMMRSYLDNHDVLGNMQDLLQDMVSKRPSDPIEFMIQRLEEVCHAGGDFNAEVSGSGSRSSLRDASTKDEGEVAEDEDSDEYDEGLTIASPAREDETFVVPRRPRASERRRPGVSAEAMSGTDDGSWVPPVYEKSQEAREQLSNIVRTSHDSKLHMLFGTVSQQTFEKILDAVALRRIPKGERVIEQGGVGDYFYIVKSGAFAIIVQKENEPAKKVFEAGVGFAFGELALLYNAPRSATIQAIVDSEVWSLDRTAFRNLVVRSAEAQFKQNVAFLNGVDMLHVLNESERAALAEVLEEEEFEDDEAIVEQGEHDSKMFIVRSGKAAACIKGEQGEVEVMQYSVGDYFGEIALLSGEPRKASVYAVGRSTCLYISRQTFLRVLGPLQSLLERNISKYEKYQDAIKSAISESLEPDVQHEESIHIEEEFHGGIHLPGTRQHKVVVNRKRDRNSVNLAKEKSNKFLADAKLREEVGLESLATKVAQDFQNPALVAHCSTFEVPGAIMSLHGGLHQGQKFTEDIAFCIRSNLAPTSVGEDDVYAWQLASKLKEATEICVSCQKGQKMLHGVPDPTPNQDNFFVHNVGAVTLYGVFDGHGPFGHLVSFRLVQTLPHFLAKSMQFGKDWEQALKEAFLAAQHDLVQFCGTHDINIQASGAAGSVLVLEEQTVHVAFIGDARVLLGSWSRRDSRMIFSSADHKPELPAERARLEAAGSEVREIDKGTFRVYNPGTNFPGLTMSRAFGDLACGGILQEPEYHQFPMQPTDQWYAILASDGLWEFMDSEEVSGLAAKKLRLKGPRETANFLTTASRKRWAYCCGEYCDDITVVLVQWNAPENKESKTNHSLAVKRLS